MILLSLPVRMNFTAETHTKKTQAELNSTMKHGFEICAVRYVGRKKIHASKYRYPALKLQLLLHPSHPMLFNLASPLSLLFQLFLSVSLLL